VQIKVTHGFYKIKGFDENYKSFKDIKDVTVLCEKNDES
jgi:hypothetical protein